MQADQLAQEAMDFGSELLREPEAKKTLEDRLKVLTQITRLLGVCGESRSVVNQFHHTMSGSSDSLGTNAM